MTIKMKYMQCNETTQHQDKTHAALTRQTDHTLTALHNTCVLTRTYVH